LHRLTATRGEVGQEVFIRAAAGLIAYFLLTLRSFVILYRFAKVFFEALISPNGEDWLVMITGRN
jgi:hypothetical protein